MTGDLDRRALRQAADSVIERHEALRSRFVFSGTQLVQRICPHGPVTVPLVDFDDGIGSNRRTSEIARLCQQLGKARFDLGRDAPLRLALFDAGNAHVLALCIHHISADGWSIDIFFRDLWSAYGTCRNGDHSGAPSLPIRYVDYAAWEGEPGDAGLASIQFWKERLRGASLTMPLPLDRPRPTRLLPHGDRVDFVLDAAAAAAVRMLASRERATPFIVMLAAFKALLAEWCGTDDVIVGSAFANRARQETTEVIGPFVNSVVLRTDLGGDPTFTECVARVRDTVLAASVHQGVPFDRLVKAINTVREGGVHPLFQVWYVHDESSTPRSVHGLELEPLFTERDAVRHDLKLATCASADGIRGACEYRTALFERRSIEGFTRRFVDLLSCAAASPSRRLSGLGADRLSPAS